MSAGEFGSGLRDRLAAHASFTLKTEAPISSRSLLPPPPRPLPVEEVEAVFAAVRTTDDFYRACEKLGLDVECGA